MSSRANKQQTWLCLDHPNEIYTNYCTSYECLRPLCPECMQYLFFHSFPYLGMFSHNMMHKQKKNFPEIDSLKGVLLKSSQILKSNHEKLYTEMKLIDDLINVPQRQYHENVVRLQQTKAQLISMVESFFTEVYGSLSQSFHEIQKRANQIKPLFEKLKDQLTENEYMIQKMEHKDSQFFSILQNMFLKDPELLLVKVQCQLKEIFKDRNEQLELKIPIDVIYILQQELEKQVIVKQRVYQFNSLQPDSKMNTQGSSSIRQQENQNIFVQKAHSSLINDSFSATPNQSDRQEYLTTNFQPNDYSYEVSEQDFFKQNCGNKFLHFFQNDSNKLFLLDVSVIGKASPQFILVELQHGFIVPNFHKSISMPNGDIVLVGGTLEDGMLSMGKVQKSGTVYQFDFGTDSMKSISMMNYPRSSHGLAYLNGYIYAIGGYEAKHQMNKHCERMGPSRKWEVIASLNYNCASMSVCSFGKNHLFKFGGITLNQSYYSNVIERYDTDKNEWQVIVYQGQNVEHLSTSASIQINSSQIMVFGGYDEENEGSVQCYIMNINDDYHIKIDPQIQLPHPEAFWNSQIIIYENQVFALQNISGENDESCLEDERNVLIFNGNSWNEL